MSTKKYSLIWEKLETDGSKLNNIKNIIYTFN